MSSPIPFKYFRFPISEGRRPQERKLPVTPQAWKETSSSQLNTPAGFSKKNEEHFTHKKELEIIPTASRTAHNSHTPMRPMGPPPPSVVSHAPSFKLTQMEPFGKLILTIMRGKNLKGGQGVFGRADPYVKIILNGKEKLTKTHSQGGKSPVSHSNNLSK